MYIYYICIYSEYLYMKLHHNDHHNNHYFLLIIITYWGTGWWF